MLLWAFAIDGPGLYLFYARAFRGHEGGQRGVPMWRLVPLFVVISSMQACFVDGFPPPRSNYDMGSAGDSGSYNDALTGNFTPDDSVDAPRGKLDASVDADGFSSDADRTDIELPEPDFGQEEDMDVRPDAEVLVPDAELPNPDMMVLEPDMMVLEPDMMVLEPDMMVLEPDMMVIVCSTCTDGICEGIETYVNCPSDCPLPPEECGNGFCDFPAEDRNNCPQDCAPEGAWICGDRACNTAAGENWTNCTNDCSFISACGGRDVNGDGNDCDPRESCESCDRDCGDCLPNGDEVCE